MTREFNKQRRDDSRPSFRDKSSGRDGEERSPRPARPRLSRETVDRAWESGAQHHHADYRPRSSQEQSPRWRNNQQSEHSSSHQGPAGNRPYGNRQDNRWNNSQRNESQGYQGPRSRSFDTDRRNTGNQGFRDNPQSQGRNFRDNPQSQGRNFRDNPQSQGRNFRDNPQSQGRNFRDNPQPQGRSFRDRDNAHPGGRDLRNPSSDRGASQYRDRNQDRSDRRDFDRSTSYSRDNDRGGRSLRSDQRSGSETYHSRLQGQDRPSAHRYNENWEPERSPHRSHREEHFEGDYERFDHADASRRSARPVNKPGVRTRDNEPEERHVTRLTDGRVLKGPRPVQRRNAQFWTDITEDTKDLITNVHVPEVVAVQLTTEDTEQQRDSDVGDKESGEQIEREVLSEEEKVPLLWLNLKDVLPLVTSRLIRLVLLVLNHHSAVSNGLRHRHFVTKFSCVQLYNWTHFMQATTHAELIGE